ncbi:MAG: hypothetical protein ACJ75S_08280 [Solirubrobacterales bacterium]
MNGRVILVTAVGGARGSKAAAAALACAGSEPDRPGLLIDVGDRAPRPTLVSSVGSREMEERLAVHLPQLRAASRGQTCHLAVDDDPTALGSIRTALPLVRESVAVIHLRPPRLREVLGETGIRASGALLRADLGTDRGLTALAVRGLFEHGLRVAILKQPLAWVPARRALFGMMPPAAPGGLPAFLRKSLLESEISAAHA